jgi:hypothetical protein
VGKNFGRTETNGEKIVEKREQKTTEKKRKNNSIQERSGVGEARAKKEDRIQQARTRILCFQGGGDRFMENIRIHSQD